jgi:hypothetical protein
VKDHWLLRRAFPCPFSGLTVSLLQETPGFSNTHSIRPEGEARHPSNAVYSANYLANF